MTKYRNENVAFTQFLGMPEDEDLRYVWAVAELERSLKESIKRRDVLQRVVGYQKQEIDG